jgi:hypothetical protein
MKCAAAVMCTRCGNEPLIVIRNQAGVFRSRNVTTPGATSWTFVTTVQ